MKAVLLIDFGSTYTKLTAVDVEGEVILGTAQAYTTVETDINDGLHEGLRRLEEKTGKLDFDKCYACSSAAGGLRMVTSGLVPELTGEAAKMASLGAGAKVVGIYAFQLTEDDLDEIRAARPDIFLLVGGTDGGNTENILLLPVTWRETSLQTEIFLTNANVSYQRTFSEFFPCMLFPGLPRGYSGKETTCLPMQETQEAWVQSLGQEDPLEKEIAT